MKNIFSKLNSRRGASLIIALVFMLVCCFVGGSVLAAATANGGRIPGLTTEKQAYLDQRSAAQLLTDEFAAGSGDKNRLTVQLTEETWKPVTVNHGVVTPDGSRIQFTEKTLSFKAFSKPTSQPLREILYESAAMRYLNLTYKDEEGGLTYTEVQEQNAVNYENFTAAYGNFFVQLSADGSEPAPVTLTLQDPLQAGKTVEAKIECLSSEDDLYSIAVTFGDGGQLNLHMNAKVSSQPGVTVPPFVDTHDGMSGYWQVTKTTTTTVIDWDNPTVVKGGAES